jgi:plastocyanin
VALIVAGALAGCGSSSSTSTSSGTTAAKASTSGGSLSVSETEFKITPKDASVPSTGTIAITAHNNGKIIHALAVRTPSGVVRTPPIQPGGSAILTVSLTKAGSYRLFCPIDHHAQLGMVGTLTVGGAAAGGAGTAGTTTTTSHAAGGY